MNFEKKWQLWPKNVSTHILQSLYNFISTLAFEALKAQNDNLVVIDMNDDRLVEYLKLSINKGQEVLIHSFDVEKVPIGLIDVFHRRMTERIHAFVGLMGIPIMRKDLRYTAFQMSLSDLLSVWGKNTLMRRSESSYF